VLLNEWQCGCWDPAFKAEDEKIGFEKNFTIGDKMQIQLFKRSATFSEEMDLNGEKP